MSYRPPEDEAAAPRGTVRLLRRVVLMIGLGVAAALLHNTAAGAAPSSPDPRPSAVEERGAVSVLLDRLTAPLDDLGRPPTPAPTSAPAPAAPTPAPATAPAPAVVDGVIGIVSPVASTPAAVVEGVTPVAEGGAPMLGAVVDGSAPVVSATVPVIGPVVEGVTPVVQGVTPVVEGLAMTLGPLANGAAPVVETVTPMIDPLVETVTPMIDPLVETVTPMIDPLVEVVTPVIEVVRPVIEVVTPVIAVVRPVIDPLIEALDPVADILDPVTGPLLPGPESVGPGPVPGLQDPVVPIVDGPWVDGHPLSAGPSPMDLAPVETGAALPTPVASAQDAGRAASEASTPVRRAAAWPGDAASPLPTALTPSLTLPAASPAATIHLIDEGDAPGLPASVPSFPASVPAPSSSADRVPSSSSSDLAVLGQGWSPSAADTLAASQAATAVGSVPRPRPRFSPD